MINKRTEKVGSIVLILLCMGILFGYASGQSNGNMGEEQEVAEVFLPGEEQVSDQQETEEETQALLVEEEQETEEESQALLVEEETETEAVPQFLLTEEEQKLIENTWANSNRSRIAYMDGYYYYSSQSDHYYLYRVKEDGSEPQCLAKIHPGSIGVQDGYVYFINQSDGHGIYRIKADGTGMEKLCEDGHNLQISNEYVFFCSSFYEETLETTGVIVEGQKNGGLYRMKKDGSERKLIAEDVWDYVLSNGYSQETGNRDVIYYSRSKGDGMTAYKMDFDGQKTEELCQFVARGTLLVCGDNLYSVGEYYSSGITRFCLKNGEKNSLSIPKYTDSCIYKGYFYGLCEQEEEQQVKLNVYRMDLSSGDIETLYEDRFQWEGWHNGTRLSGLYATENGVFFRWFVSKEDGCRWFRVTEDGDVKEFEDRENIPVTLPAEKVDYGELLSVTLVLNDMSTEGYDAYLADGLRYEEYFSVDKDGEPRNPCRINLPQFNSKIAGYQQINAYIQNVLYQEALQEKDDFVEELDKENPQKTSMYSRSKGYDYVYIGEDYITVGIYGSGYTGGVRGWESYQPITFDRRSGEVVSLEDILGMTIQEAVARLMGAVYKYQECIRNGEFFLREGNVLTKEFEMDNFMLFSQGVGIYYRRGALGPQVAGDYLFIIPWEDAISAP